MGAYINPPTETKESFLEKKGTKTEKPLFKDCPPDSLIVVLMDNGFFTAAGIAYSEREYQAFTDPTDNRPKKFYFVKKDDLMGVSNLQEYLL